MGGRVKRPHPLRVRDPEAALIVLMPHHHIAPGRHEPMQLMRRRIHLVEGALRRTEPEGSGAVFIHAPERVGRKGGVPERVLRGVVGSIEHRAKRIALTVIAIQPVAGADPQLPLAIF